MNSATAKRLKFAQGLFAGMEQREAALAAGYLDGPGLNAVASKLTKHVEVKAELARLAAAGGVAAVAARDEALAALTSVLRSDLGPYMVFDEHGQFSHLDAARMKADGKTGTLSSLDVKRDETQIGEVKTIYVRTQVKLLDKLGAIDRLAKLLAWAPPEKVEHSGTVQVQSRTEDELRARAAELWEKLKERGNT